MLERVSAVSPSGAKHISQRIEQILKYLAAFPYAGTNANRAGMRRLVVNPYPYAIYYSATDDFVTVLGVRHTAQNPADMPDAR